MVQISNRAANSWKQSPISSLKAEKDEIAFDEAAKFDDYRLVRNDQSETTHEVDAGGKEEHNKKIKNA